MTAVLLDTNVISETVKKQPAPAVLTWFEGQSPADLYLSAMTLGELIRGARRLRDSARRERLETWINIELIHQFDGRILPFDRMAAVIWGEIMGDGDRSGQTRPAADAQIAAIARRYDLPLATRNGKDFAGMGVALVDPWEPTSSVISPQA